MIKFYFFVLSLLIIIAISLSPLQAQRQEKSIEDCINNFNIDNLDNKMLEIGGAESLVDYVICLSCVDNNKAKKIMAFRAMGPYKNKASSSLPYLISVIKYDNITPEIIQQCVSAGEMNADECRKSFQASKSKDIAICKDNKECIAKMTLNPNLASLLDNRDIIYFMKAIKDSDIDTCLNIEDSTIRTGCQAHIKGDKRICERLEEFKQFRQTFCHKQLLRKGGNE